MGPLLKLFECVGLAGSNGRLRAAMDALKSVPKEQKPAIGKRMRELKTTIEGVFNAAKDSTGSAPKVPVVDSDCRL
jgi:hypothetical protein